MTVDSFDITDVSPRGYQWELPPGQEQQRSPVPRGLIVFAGTDAISAKIANDERTYNLVITMPSGGAYLPRNLFLRARSDDLVNNWTPTALATYDRSSISPSPGSGSQGQFHFNLVAPGILQVLAIVSQQLYVPGRGSAKLMLAGGDTMQFWLQDVDSAASAAGDVDYNLEFYVFASDQVDKWQVNTPIPTISHTSF